MLGPLFAAAVEVWVAVQGGDASDAGPGTCGADALVGALRAVRPTLQVHAWVPSPGEAPPTQVVTATLARRESGWLLQVEGSGLHLSRPLPDDGCDRVVRTAGLIVDGALDELAAPRETPLVDSLAPPVPLYRQLHLSIAAGAGGGQGPLAAVPVFAGGLQLRWRDLEASLEGSAELPTSAPFAVLPPEAAATGSLAVWSGSVDLALAYLPRVGPGRVVLGIGAGLSLTHASVSASGLFQQAPTTALAPDGLLRLGYTLDLPLRLFLAVRAEGRVTAASTFEIVGVNFGGALPTQDAVTTKVWTLRGLAMLGVHFS